MKRLLGIAAMVSITAIACTASEGDAPVAVSPVATASPSGPRGAPPTAPASPRITITVQRGASPAATVRPGAPLATPNVAGRAITVNDVQQAWTARNITYRATSGAPPATGFSAPASPLTLTKAGQSVDVILFTYPDQATARQDWELGPTSSAPRTGRTLGAFAAVWWNENVVVVLRTRLGDITNEARDAFLSLGGPIPTIPAPTATSAAGATATPAPTKPAGSPSPAATIAGATPTATGAAAVTATRTPAPAVASPTPPAPPATATPMPSGSPPTPQVPR